MYLVYTNEQQNESDDTDIYVRYSDDAGATWSAGVRVNDDHTREQPVPAQDLARSDDRATSRSSGTTPGPISAPAGPATPTASRTTTRSSGVRSAPTDGASFTTNLQISAGTSNSHASGNGIDYGDYSGLSFVAGVAHPAWSDNSNSTGTNPDGALHQLDIYTAAVTP